MTDEREIAQSQEFHKLNEAKAGLINLDESIEKIASTCKTEHERKQFLADMTEFRNLFEIWTDPSRKTQAVDWQKIQPPPAEMLLNHSDLPTITDHEKTKALMQKLVVLKLNGGLGTTMGCTGPKSAIEVVSAVDQHYTFLDLNVRQIVYLNKTYGVDIPLVLMNSFNTHEETKRIISKYQNSEVTIKTFNQHRYPRVWRDNKLPMADSYYADNGDEWYPPGHGDVYGAFANSSIFEELKAQGKEFVFLANIDNLGATPDPAIMNYLDTTDSEFVMEVTDKTRADIKGGTLISYEGHARLLEIAQVPTERIEEFKSVKKFKIFNTNNLWMKLSAIHRLNESKGMADMDVLINNKTARDKAIVQLERAAGSAIKFFKNAVGINVPRSRFLPVKGTGDLLLVQSNLYTVSHGTLTLNELRPFPTIPLVKLGPTFKKVGDYSRRFASIPDLLELDHLTVSGDVTFGNGVILKGTVIIVANHGNRIDIPDGAILENKVVSGIENFRTLDVC